VAVASSPPELSSVVVSALVHGDFELGMASIVGSAIFNILAIPGLSALVDRKALAVELRLVYRDAQFYLTSVAVLLLTFSFAIIYAPLDGADPDAIISLRSARRGDGDLSIGNVLGSNVFDLLVAITEGVLIAGAAVVDYRVAAPLMAFLTLGTVVLFTFLRTSLQLGW